MMAKANGSFYGGGANMHMIRPYTMTGRIRWDILSYSSRSTSMQVVERLRLAPSVPKEKHCGRFFL